MAESTIVAAEEYPHPSENQALNHKLPTEGIHGLIDHCGYIRGWSIAVLEP